MMDGRDIAVNECKTTLYTMLSPDGLEFIRQSRGIPVGDGVQRLIDMGELDADWTHKHIREVIAATCEMFLELTVNEP